MGDHYVIELDHESGEGCILIRDSAPYELVEGALAELATRGWHEVDPEEAMEPHEFADGGLGVKVYLYQEHQDQEVANGIATTGR